MGLHDVIRDTATNKLLQEMDLLKAEMQSLKRQIGQTPNDWLSISEARNYFIKNGKAVSTTTMHEYVNGWIDNGTLIQGQNLIIAGNIKYISSKFLCDTGQKPIVKLKKAV